MNWTPRGLRELGLIAALGIGSLSFAGIDLDVSFRIGNEAQISPILPDSSGPPPWAPAHGRRAKANYYYYPEHQVYRDAASGVWIFLQDGNWQVEAKLPLRFEIGESSTFVSLEMDSDQPYRYHHQVMEAYPQNNFARISIDIGSETRPGRSGKNKVPPGQVKKQGKPKRK